MNDAPNLSPAVLARLKTGWQEEFERWKRRDLSARRYVYIWADGVYLQARMEPDKQCIFVLIGATPEGRKELIGFQTGYRESAQSRSERLSKSVQPKAKADLREIWMAPGRVDAEKAFDRFLARYQAKYEKASACLAKNRKALLAFYDFPAEHWKHIRTGNPIESTFATVRHRTTRAKGCLSHDTGMIMVFKMIQTAQNSWRRLDGQNQLPKIITGIKFTDGIEAGHKDAA